MEKAVLDVPAPAIGFLIAVVAYHVIVLLGRRRFSLGAVWKLSFPRSIYNWEKMRADVGNWLFTVLLFGPLIQVFLIAVSVATGLNILFELNRLLGPRAELVSSQGAICAVQFAAGILIRTLFDYWAHRIAHEVPLLWSLHHAHHSTEALTFFARTRGHPLDHLWMLSAGTLGGAIGSGVALFLIGAQPALETSIGVTVAFYILMLTTICSDIRISRCHSAGSTR